MNRASGGGAGSSERIDEEELGEALKVILGAVAQAISGRPELARAALVLARAIQPSGEAPASKNADDLEDASDDVAEGVEESALPPQVEVPGPETLEPTLAMEPERVESPVLDTYELPSPPVLACEAAEPAWRTVEVDLGVIAQRSRLKLKVLEWVVSQRAIPEEECSFEAQAPANRWDLIAEARELEGCFLWMLYDSVNSISDADVLAMAGCYRAVALLAEQASGWGSGLNGPEDERDFKALLALGAEAQSALRCGLENAGQRRDTDQFELWAWIRQASDRDEVYLERHMVLEDPASPAGLADFNDRLEALVEGRRERSGRAKRRKSALNTLEYHIKTIEGGLGEEGEVDEENLVHDWEKVVSTVGAWVKSGGQVTDRDLLAQLARIADLIPENYVEGQLERVMREVERWRDGRSEMSAGENPNGEKIKVEGPASVTEVLERILEQFPNRIAFAWNKRSHKTYPYARPLELEHALRWLVTDVWEMRANGSGSGDFRVLGRQLRERCGWFYRPRQSATTIGRYPEWYRCTFEGRSLTLEEHMGRGNVKRGGNSVIRVAFAWDETSRKIVVGFLGQHQKTPQS